MTNRTRRRLRHLEYFVFGVCVGIVVATIIYNTI